MIALPKNFKSRTAGATFGFEYALSRTASPALIAQYQAQLPDKALLQSKLHEFYLQNTGLEGESM